MDEASNQIVVGVDGSPGSEQALRWALRLAMATRMEIEAVLVWSDNWAITGPPTLFGAGSTGRRRLRATIVEAVGNAVRHEPGSERVTVVERVLPGDPAEVLLAESETAAMLVVGSTGAGGIRRLMLGSVSQYCSDHARVPVVIVPTAGHRQPAASRPKQQEGGVRGDAEAARAPVGTAAAEETGPAR